MKECRICLEESDNLIKPCKCSGTQNYVHQECIEKWRSYNTNNENFFRCQECLANYELEEVDLSKKKVTKNLIVFIHKLIKNHFMFGFIVSILSFFLIGFSIYSIPNSEIFTKLFIEYDFIIYLKYLIIGSFISSIIDFIIIISLLIYIVRKDYDLQWKASNDMDIGKLTRLNIFFLGINLFSPLAAFFVNLGNFRYNTIYFIEFVFYNYIYQETRIINLEETV